MKILIKLVVIAILAAVLGRTVLAQTGVDSAPCDKVVQNMASEVTAFNSAHKDGAQLAVMCEISNANIPKKPEIHIPLTSSETDQLHRLRRLSHEVNKDEDDYESWLIKHHGVHEMDFHEACWHFVGIVRGTDYITVDPNSSMPDPACR